ncbi:hypothetical protein B4U80_10999 [Leptotrombidium deliense]|uniref:Conserved oligomeric Golgi complex subunit 8 n=1 Tax=Leptotrombidium deliense TaxID=299467 RepID=A0A443SHD3_9ACAR|nr:hypothetical protein B4U80_10999 [Leptotrombidium deliense]
MPPLTLLEFVPLAQLCNDILTGFNEFRQLIPIGLMKKIKDELEVSLQQISTSIAHYYEYDNHN